MIGGGGAWCVLILLVEKRDVHTGNRICDSGGFVMPKWLDKPRSSRLEEDSETCDQNLEKWSTLSLLFNID